MVTFESDLCSFKQSVALKEIGFVGLCTSWYNSDGHLFDKFIKSEDSVSSIDLLRYKITESHTLAPEKNTIIDWFKIVHGLYAFLFVDDDKTFGYHITYFTFNARVDKPIKYRFETTEQAKSACIDELIEIVKNTNNYGK